MLDEDIAQQTLTTTGAFGKIAGAALRGAVLFGLCALAGGMMLGALPGVMAAFAAPSLATGIMGAASALLSSEAIATGLLFGKFGALAGAAVLGTTSMIPGSQELPEMKNEKVAAQELTKGTKDTPQRTQELGKKKNAEHPLTLGDNPYFKPGLGQTLLAREQQAASQALTKNERSLF